MQSKIERTTLSIRNALVQVIHFLLELLQVLLKERRLEVENVI